VRFPFPSGAGPGWTRGGLEPAGSPTAAPEAAAPSRSAPGAAAERDECASGGARPARHESSGRGRVTGARAAGARVDGGRVEGVRPGDAEPGEARVHGLGTDLVAPDWPPIGVAEAAFVLAVFGVRGPLKVLWRSPRPFSSAVRVQTSRGEVLIKRHDARVRRISDLAEEDAFVAHLAAAGLPVARAWPTPSGAPGVAGEGVTYEVFPILPGSDRYREAPSWTPLRSPAEARAAGRTLAALHRAAVGFDRPGRRTQVLIDEPVAEEGGDPTDSLLARIAARPALADFGRRLGSSEIETCRAVLAPLAERLEPHLGRLVPSWAHNDWHGSNLLWSPRGDAVVGIFDFGLSGRTSRHHDVAIALERNAIAWLDLPSAAEIGRPEIARALLSGYDELWPLAPADRAAVAALLPLAHLGLALSEVAYYDGILADPERAAVAWHAYLVGHAAWFLSAAGRRFLVALGA
jgi:Ser/Thr protein kinase RdoA (MazF antagonist)